MATYETVPLPGELTAESRECVQCHQKESPGRGAAVGLVSALSAPMSAAYECHSALIRDDADAFMHYGQRIATIVSPKDCGQVSPQSHG